LKWLATRAGQDEGGIFSSAVSAAELASPPPPVGRIRLRGQDGDRCVIGLELRHVGAEVGGRVAGPDGFVVGAVGDGEARANHVQLVLYA